MTTETNVQNLKINTMTAAQYATITPSSTELYMVTDATLSSTDVTTALGYTPYNATNPNGYTSNVGTITGIKMNGSSKGTSGVVDLGTVITAHQDISGKQDTLVSGTNIKTINGNSLLGSGNITIEAGSDIDVDTALSTTSTNPVQNKVITTELNQKLENTATGSNALTINGTASAYYGSVNIGSGSRIVSNTSQQSVAIGYNAKVDNNYRGTAINGTIDNSSIVLPTLGGGTSVAIEGMVLNSEYAVAIKGTVNSAEGAIQIGYGQNTVANSMNIGFYNTSNTHYNWQLLDGSTGLIPDDRLSSNIARTSAIPTVNNATLTITQGGTTKGTFTANASSNVTIDLDAGGGGATRNIGEIVASTIPLTDAGLHLLDGALIQGSGIYSAFVTYIAGLRTQYSNLFTTESAWQSAVTQYGACGKFVYNSTNNTVRLPKITGIIEGTTDLTALGDLVEAGLPNITGWFADGSGNNAGLGNDYSYTQVNGCFGKTSIGSGKTLMCTSSSYDAGRIDFDASNSSSIYGNSPSVQPQTIKVLYYIVIATSTKTDIQVDIDEIATDLNGKADVDLSNCTKPHIVETYQNGSSWYRVYSDGWCEQGGSNIDTGTSASQSVNITFLKPFINTNYVISLSLGKDNTNPDTNGTYARTNKTTTSFQIRRFGTTTRYADWQACGYIS